jgi:uncharacterized repeat protein (TIGR01451 family)
LVPGQSGTFVATYTLTQADLDNGSVNDSATATGTPPTGAPVTSVTSTPSVASITTISSPATPAVSLVKKATVTPAADQGGVKVGDTIAYSYVVTNTGNVDLTSVAVSDPTLGAVTCMTPASPGLAPGATETCSASSTHTVTQADVDTGSVTDTATATGTDPGGGVSPVSAPSTVTVPANQAPAIAIVKTASQSTFSGSGQMITYTYVVTNTGNVTLSGVTVTDPMPGLSAISCPATALAPGATQTCTASYTTTKADVNAGMAANVGTATGSDALGAPSVKATSSSTVVIHYTAPTLIPSALVSPIVSIPIAVTG